MAKRRTKPNLETIEAVADELVRIIIGPLRDKELCWCVDDRRSCALCVALAVYSRLRPGVIESLKREYGLDESYYPTIRKVANGQKK